MMSFRADLLTSPVPTAIARLVSQVDELKGRQEVYRNQTPQVLQALLKVAMVQSTESSNRIEGIQVPGPRLRSLMAQKSAPANRSEGEVAGYRDVLATIHASHDHIDLEPNVILQLHRDLFRYVASEGGRWKMADNTIDDVLPDGTHVVRFRTVPAVATPHAMEDLCKGLRQMSERADVLPLLVYSAFVLDFLCVHPFRDGNGRMARLLTLLLLYEGGYEVGRYISLERIVEESRESYYESLAASSRGWHEGRHSLQPWWEYFLGVVAAAYREFESRVGTLATGRGAKSEQVRRTVQNHIGVFTISELERHCPGVSRDLIRTVLEQMRTDGLVVCMERGRGARWRKCGNGNE